MLVGISSVCVYDAHLLIRKNSIQLLGELRCVSSGFREARDEAFALNRTQLATMWRTRLTNCWILCFEMMFRSDSKSNRQASWRSVEEPRRCKCTTIAKGMPRASEERSNNPSAGLSTAPSGLESLPLADSRWGVTLSFTLMGVVRQEVNTSAGSSGLCGNSSLAPHAANRIHSRIGPSPAQLPGAPPAAAIDSCASATRPQYSSRNPEAWNRTCCNATITS